MNTGRNAKVKYVERKIDNEDLERAKRRIAAVVQARRFPEEVRDLKNGKPVKTSSKIIKLKPFMNEDCVMRVGGRVSMAPISADAKNPMSMPKGHHVATIFGIISYTSHHSVSAGGLWRGTGAVVVKRKILGSERTRSY